MVSNVTSLTRNGLRDWLIQRVSAWVLAAYTVFLLGYFMCHSPLTYAQWHALFTCPWMKIASLLALLSVLLHAWIGIWTVLTDYIKCSCWRLFLEIIVFLLLLSYFAWGILIVIGSV